MTVQEIARKLVELCRQGRNLEALDTLYAADAVSVEALAMPGMAAESRGIAEIKQKVMAWYANHDIHAATVSGPWPHGDRFVVGFQHEVTNHATGRRLQLDEVALYTVRDGRIVREEFFYDPGR